MKSAAISRFVVVAAMLALYQHTAVWARCPLPGFSDVSNLSLNGSARTMVDCEHVLSLTIRWTTHVSGSAWFNTEQPDPKLVLSRTTLPFQFTHPTFGSGRRISLS